MTRTRPLSRTVRVVEGLTYGSKSMRGCDSSARLASGFERLDRRRRCLERGKSRNRAEPTFNDPNRRVSVLPRVAIKP